MELVIDTSSRNLITVSLKKGSATVIEESISVDHAHGEKLLPLIDKVIKKCGKHTKIDSIRVADTGEGFSSLRIGVSVANALSYALGIPVKAINSKSKKTGSQSLVSPRYAHPPKIGK